MKLIRSSSSSSRARPYQLSYAELQLSPPLFPLLAELLPGNCDPVPVYCFFLFLFLISFLLCEFCMLQNPFALPHFLLPHFLPLLPSLSLSHSLPFLFPSPSPSCLATPGSRCAPQGTLFMQEASFAYCACFFHISTHIFFRVFRMCVFPTRAT